MIAEGIMPSITMGSQCYTLATGYTDRKYAIDYGIEVLKGIAGQLNEDTDVFISGDAATELLNDKEVYQPRTVEEDTLEILTGEVLLSFSNEGCEPHYPGSLPELFSREGSTAAIIAYKPELSLSERLVAVSPTNPSARKVWGPGVKAL